MSDTQLHHRRPLAACQQQQLHDQVTPPAPSSSRDPEPPGSGDVTCGARAAEITVTGLLAAFTGPNRDRVQVYLKATISGVVVQEHGAHTHNGVDGRIVELMGGQYAWIESTTELAGAAAA